MNGGEVRGFERGYNNRYVDRYRRYRLLTALLILYDSSLC